MRKMLQIALPALAAMLVASVGTAADPVVANPPPTVTTPAGTAVPGTPTTTASQAPRKVYDMETLKKMADTLCVDGFKAYVGDEGKNVCRSWATAPDLAYTCVWNKKGPPAFPPTPQGPCSLDYTEHRGNVIVTKSQYKSNPPLDFGTEAQCCYRSAAGY
ncbi:MAG: hypothetical protein IT572_05720 [Deltaproteobacteria bacterium]|nr:hypothetical protein [Deltaproteobacteria bacterium]